MNSQDVLIVGGGMVGGTLACALAEADFSVGIVEAQPPMPPAPVEEDYDLRVSAISRAGERILRNLGVWPGVASRRLWAFREMRVWDAAGAGAIHFDSADLGEPCLGHIVENRVLVAALAERLSELPNVTWYRPAAPAALSLEGDRLRLGLESGPVLEAGLVVGADGARSRLRELAGIACPGADYGQRAIVATVRTALPNGGTAWQRFLPGGPLAFLPLGSDTSSIVWSVPVPRAAELLALDAEGFAAVLGEAFDHRLGEILQVGERAAFPLRRQHAERYVEPRLALVGDAAHTIHPLAGQGVNLGLLDAAALAQVLREARDRGRDPGEYRVLRRYERWRKGHNLLVQGLMSGFKALFGSPAVPVRQLRNLGLDLVNAAGPLKSLLMRQAMGLEGDLPDLARARIHERP